MSSKRRPPPKGSPSHPWGQQSPISQPVRHLAPKGQGATKKGCPSRPGSDELPGVNTHPPLFSVQPVRERASSFGARTRGASGAPHEQRLSRLFGRRLVWAHKSPGQAPCGSVGALEMIDLGVISGPADRGDVRAQRVPVYKLSIPTNDLYKLVLDTYGNVGARGGAPNTRAVVDA